MFLVWTLLVYGLPNIAKRGAAEITCYSHELSLFIFVGILGGIWNLKKSRQEEQN